MFNDFFRATGTSEILKNQKQKRIDKQKLMFNWSWSVFADWRNLYIQLLWNQKSQEADIQDYVL